MLAPCIVSDRILVSDGARVGLGHHGIHRARSWRPYGMRGDGLGVRHVCEVLGGSGIRGHAAGVDDGRGAWRQYEPRVVCGRCRSEYGTECEPSRDRVGISDCAWRVNGWENTLTCSPGWAHRMRGDGMGVGHLGEVSCRARGSRDPAGGDDGGEHCGQSKSGMVRRPSILQPRPKRKLHVSNAWFNETRSHFQQSCGYGGIVDHGAWRKHGWHVVYHHGAGSAYELRVNGMGVGHIAALSCRTWGAWHTSGDVDLGAAFGEPERGVVGRRCDDR